MFGLLLCGLQQQPYVLVLSLLLLGHSVLQIRFPAIWLTTVPFLLPLLDWSPWSGWLLLQEFDLFLLAVLVIGYWQAPRQPCTAQIPLGSRLIVQLFALSWLGALLYALRDASPSQLLALGSVTDMNVLRGAKAFCFALLLIPLLRRAWNSQGISAQRRFALGALLGLTVTALIVGLERWLFPGLSNFSSEYRAVGPFFEMFAGGAALDCYIALTLPLAVWSILRSHIDWVVVGGALALALGSYAAFTTFSRGVYLAYVFSAVCLGYSFAKISAHRTSSRWSLLWLCGAAFPLWHLFGAGGYRALAAGLGLGLSTLILVPRSTPARGATASAISVALLVASAVAVISLSLPKGVYWASAGALLIAATGFAGQRVQHRHARALEIGGAFGLALCTPLVSHYWRAEAGWGPALVWVAYCGGTWLLARRCGWWQASLAELVIPVGILSVLCVMLPISGGYYMTQRFSDASRDLDGRIEHWQSVIALVSTPRAILLGQGIGRFVEESFHHNNRHELPGVFTLLDDDGRYLRLSAARYVAGYGEVIRFGQRIVGTAAYPLTFTALVRSAAPQGQLILQACDKWLLYPTDCNVSALTKISTTWQVRSVEIPGPRAADRWSWLRPREFSLATYDTNAASDIDVTALRLSDAEGNSLLANGDFTAGLMHWSYTSDRYHLPWHAKNMWLHVYFEQGLCGVVLYCLLLLSALVGLIRKLAHGNQQAPLFIAAIVGICAVGLFDSLLDFTRIACLIFLLLWLSIMVEHQPRARHRRTRHRTAALE